VAVYITHLQHTYPNTQLSFKTDDRNSDWQCIRGFCNDALYKSTFYLLTYWRGLCDQTCYSCLNWKPHSGSWLSKKYKWYLSRCYTRKLNGSVLHPDISSTWQTVSKTTIILWQSHNSIVLTIPWFYSKSQWPEPCVPRATEAWQNVIGSSRSTEWCSVKGILSL